MAQQTCPPILKPFFGKRQHQRDQFDELARAIADDIGGWLGVKF